MKETVINFEEPLILVNSTGGVVLSRTATKEKLALWIVNHQKEHEPTKTLYWPTASSIVLVIVGFVLYKKVRG